MSSSFSCALMTSPIHPLKTHSCNSALLSSPLWLLTPKTFFNNKCHLQPCRLCELLCPSAQVFNLLFRIPDTKGQNCFKPSGGYWAKLNLKEIPLPDWKLEWHLPVQTPKACISFLPSLPLHPPDKFQAMQNRLFRVLLSPSGETLRKEAGGVNPTTINVETRWLFQTLPDQVVHNPLSVPGMF